MKPGGETVAIMNFIVTPMTTSQVFKKLEAEKEQAESQWKSLREAEALFASRLPTGPSPTPPGDAGKGKGANDPTPTPAAGARLPSVQDAVRGKGQKGKGKGKPKAKGKGAEATSAEADTAGVDECLAWDAMVYPLLVEGAASVSDGGRQKTVLDDCMCLFNSAEAKARTKIGRDSDAKSELAFNQASSALLHHTMSVFQEFVWTGTAAINGKFTRTYSQFRQELITFLQTAFEVATSGAPGSASVFLSAHMSDLADGSASAVSIGSGQLMDQSDELKAIDRIKIATTSQSLNELESFVRDVLPLPLEYHGPFSMATVPESRPCSFFRSICSNSLKLKFM